MSPVASVSERVCRAVKDAAPTDNCDGRVRAVACRRGHWPIGHDGRHGTPTKSGRVRGVGQCGVEVIRWVVKLLAGGVTAEAGRGTESSGHGLR